jgi:hypothetical protein
MPDNDLLAYETTALLNRLKIVVKGTDYVPHNQKGFVQRFGYIRGPDGAIKVRWSGKRWEREGSTD